MKYDQSEDEEMPTQPRLILGLKNFQDQSTWQLFYDRYWKLIYGVAIKSGLEEPQAQVVLQETMISIAKRMPFFTYDPSIGSFKTWLLLVTQRTILSVGKDRPSASLQEAVCSKEPSATQNIDRIWRQEWEKNLMEAALTNVRRRADPLQCQIFDIVVNKKWSPEKVAASFGVTVSEVDLAKHHITAMLDEEINRLEREVT